MVRLDRAQMEQNTIAEIIGQFFDATQWDSEVVQQLYNSDRVSLFQRLGVADSSVNELLREKEIQYYLDRELRDEELATIHQQLQTLNNPNQILSKLEAKQLEIAARSLALQQREIEIRQTEAADRRELLGLYRELVDKIQEQKIAIQLTKIQADWDRDTWFSKLSRQETELILHRHRHRLLILTAPPKIAKHKGLHLFKNLDFDLAMRSVGDFLERYYPSHHEEHPVQFYSSYFREPIGNLDIERLHYLLSPVATYIFYGEIEPESMTLRVAHWGIQAEEVKFLPPLTWDWHSSKKNIVHRGYTSAAADRQIIDITIEIHRLLTAYFTDLYYLSLNPNYEPQLLLQPIAQLPSPIVHNWLDRLRQFQRDRQTIYQQELAEIVAHTMPIREPDLEPAIEIANLRQQLAIEISRRETAELLLQQLQTERQDTIDIENERGKLFEFFVPTTDRRGNIITETLQQSRCLTIDLGNGIVLEMVYIPGGTVMMGSHELDAEKPRHQIAVPAFHFSKYPITQAQYHRIVGENPAHFPGDNRPVEQVSWWDALRFCRKLSAKTQQTYRLPSEAEWEYACRAGTSTAFHFGDGITLSLANYHRNVGYPSSVQAKSREETTNVGSYPPNAFGLYDLHGNVSEWCQDTWHDNYAGAPTDGSAWITMRENEHDAHILRGGSWYYSERGCRSATRDYYAPDYSSMSIGFRVVLH
jgi:formylglycine-generating enzyme required for sulfatase activity